MTGSARRLAGAAEGSADPLHLSFQPGSIGAGFELTGSAASLMNTIRKILACLLLAASPALASDSSSRLLARAWPYDPAQRVSELGRGIGIVFSPDLSVPGNCRFYEALGFTCFADTDWSRVLDGIRTHNLLYPESPIRTLVLETHGTNGNGLKLQQSYDPSAERSYVAVGALQERLESDGVDYVIISACNSGRLMRPAIYKQIDRWNGDRLFLPATCGIIDADEEWDPTRSNVTVLSPASSHIETTVVGSFRELSAAARARITASAKEKRIRPPGEFAVSDILCQILLRDPALELAAGAYVDELSAAKQDDAVSERLFRQFVRLINGRAALESAPPAKNKARRKARTKTAVKRSR
jgi:hypothetical protein